jgi:DNA-binding transcriptional MocR family regulator
MLRMRADCGDASPVFRTQTFSPCLSPFYRHAVLSCPPARIDDAAHAVALRPFWFM